MNQLSTVLTLASLIESELAPQGFHIALTGGCLYKTGERKDVDFILYCERDRDVPRNMMKVLLDLDIAHLRITQYFGFVIKATYGNLNIDFLYPEYTGGTYNKEELDHNSRV